MDTDIVIVGDGPVAALLARMLATTNLSLVMLTPKANSADPEPLTPINDSRVYALSYASKKLLQTLDIWQPLSENACPFRQIQVRDRNGTGKISFQAENSGLTELGYIVRHSEMMRVLTSCLDQQENLEIRQVNIKDLHRDASGTMHISHQDGKIKAQLVIGADGQSSTVRELANMPLYTWDCEQTAIVFVVQFEQPHNNNAYQVFLDHGPLAILPLNDQDQTWNIVIWSVDNSHLAQLQAPKDADICMHDALENRFGRIVKTGKRQYIPLYQKLAKCWVKPGIALVGDAARSIHPLAGQGLNLSLNDLISLVTIIKNSASWTSSWTSSYTGRGFAFDLYGATALRSYQYQRLPKAMAMITLMSGFKNGFQAAAPELRWLRNSLLNICDRNQLLKSRIVRFASGQVE